MIKAACQHDQFHKHGKDRKGNIRYKCVLCGKTFVKETAKPIGELRIDLDRATMAISMMLEGLSINSIQRLTGIHRQTLCDPDYDRRRQLPAVLGYDNSQHPSERRSA